MALYKGETLISSEFILPPIKENTKIFFSHFGRYFYASKVLGIKSSDVVIDASTGNGYGAYSIAQKAKEVYGLDVNEDYISLAKKNYASDNVYFLTYNDFYKIFPYLKAHKILCIESYEHVPKYEIISFMDKLLSKLKVGGDMFVTVPLGNNKPSSYNPYHENEPSIDVLYNMFSPHFTNINAEIDSFTNSFGHDCQYCYLILKNKKE